MTGKAILLNKQIWLAVGMITFIGAVVASGTGAFFSDTADVTGNTFAAGTLDLQLTQNKGGGSPADTQSALWDFENMAPGGTPETSSVWLRNSGSVDGATLGVAIPGGWTNPSNIAAQMRITEMTLDGNNLLEGGAGATIPEYEAPTNCTVTLGGSDRITDAIFNASNGDVICATGTSYSAAWEDGATNPFNGSSIVVDKEVTIASVNGPENTSSIGFNVTADNVTIRGFSIETNQDTGIQINNADGAIVEHNIFEDFGDITGTTNKQAVYLVNTSSNAIVQYNKFDGVYNGTKSVKAIYVGHTGGALNASNILVQHNIINDVESVGGGGYGVLVNHAGAVSGLTVQNNTFSDITGTWVSVVGLEGNTPNAQVALNSFSGLNGITYPANAVHFESNAGASSVVINENNFESGQGGVAMHPTNQTGTYTVDATNNWWGDFDSSDQVFENNSTINTTPIAGGPFAGLVNGTDFNGNGYADLHDLRQDPITGITPGLDAYDGSNDQEFVMGVQLDGPTTGNNFQGLSLEDVEIEFSLNQI